MPDLNRDVDAMRRVLENARVIAVVGHSDKPDRTSYQIAQYLRQAGYRVYPVNPTVKTIDGLPSYASLADIPEPIDIVSVFRASEFLPQIVQDAIDVGAKAVWAQPGVVDESARPTALDAGLDVAMNTCIRVQHRQLLG